MPSPIHLAEFVTAIARCLPAVARSFIAVANSGGPDSTCLLFLLRRLFSPDALLSLHVAHDLQSASDSMAAAAAANASALGVPHRTIHVPWGVPPFPPLPVCGPLECIARDARYNILFGAITQARVPFLALAHHADDQLETAIMRLARGSSLLGAAGMRSSRRWGMGASHSLTSRGYDGLNSFLLRPLLSFPKDRILATCHANRLRYAIDPTNFQPHLTARNAIRHCLREHDLATLSISPPLIAPFSLKRVNHARLLLDSTASDVVDSKQRLYCAVSRLATRAERVDRQVTFHLPRAMLPSPTGTLLLSSNTLLDIADPDVRLALVLRAIRYVSFHPWGSLSADAHRRHSSIHRVVNALWTPHPQASHLSKFTAGGGVLWSPAIFHPNKPLKVGNQCLHSILQPGHQFCWLASRTPPFTKNPHQHGAGSPIRLVMDITDPLRVAMPSHDPIRILYDCRFLLRIQSCQIPTPVKSALEEDDTTRIKVLPFTRYYWPKVVLQRESHPDQVLAAPEESGTLYERTSPSWISIQWVRPLDSI